jgi:hypothetical protein
MLRSRLFWAATVLTVIFGSAAIGLFVSHRPGSLFLGFGMIALLAIAIGECRSESSTRSQATDPITQ